MPLTTSQLCDLARLTPGQVKARLSKLEYAEYLNHHTQTKALLDAHKRGQIIGVKEQYSDSLSNSFLPLPKHVPLEAPDYSIAISSEDKSPAKPSASKVSESVSPQFVPHPDDMQILRVLAKSKTTMKQYDLEAEIRLSRRTISERLTKLREKGLTHRPNGQRGGEAITDSGRALLHANEGVDSASGR